MSGIGIATPRKAIVQAWNEEQEVGNRDFLS